MRDRWVNKNVDLSMLIKLLRQFFEEKGFKVLVEEQLDIYKIIALPKSGSDILDTIEVLVHGNPNDFVVEFGTSTKHSKKLIQFGGLAYIFVGGYLMTKGLKSQEEIAKIEREFWNFINLKLPSLERK